MFCSYCGKKVADTDKFCKDCGAPLKPEAVEKVAEVETVETVEAVETQVPEKKKFCGKAIAGFVLSLVGIFFAGLICGTIGLVLSNVALNKIKADNSLRGKGLAIAGFVISIIDMVIMVIYFGML